MTWITGRLGCFHLRDLLCVGSGGSGMMEPLEATELFKCWAISETEYREALAVAGCPNWLANELVSVEIQARYANDTAAKKEGIYA